MEMKRDFDGHNVMGKREENVSLPDAPLFERYQYFSPGMSSLPSFVIGSGCGVVGSDKWTEADERAIGIFMGLLIMLPLFLILYVGVSGMGSLQVTYAAFDREMGPAAHKKQQ